MREFPPPVAKSKAQQDIDNANAFRGKNVLGRELAHDAKVRAKDAPEQSPLDAMKATRARLVKEEAELKKAINAPAKEGKLDSRNLHRRLAKVQNALDYADISDGDRNGAHAMRDSETARKRLMSMPVDGPEEAPSIALSDTKRTYQGFTYTERDKKGRERAVTYKPQGNWFRRAVLTAESPIGAGASAQAAERGTRGEGTSEKLKDAESALQMAFHSLMGASKPDKRAYDAALNALVNVISEEPGMPADKKEKTFAMKSRAVESYLIALLAATLPENAEPAMGEKMFEALYSEFYRRHSIKKNRPGNWKMFSDFTRELPRIIRAMRRGLVGQGHDISSRLFGVRQPGGWKRSGLAEGKDVAATLDLFEKRAKLLARHAPIF